MVVSYGPGSWLEAPGLPGCESGVLGFPGYQLGSLGLSACRLGAPWLLVRSPLVVS